MDSNTSPSTKLDVYQIVSHRIITLLEKGTAPWQKPWADAGIPMNLISKRPYRGVNLWLLLSLEYERNLFLTWDQLKKIGGSVKQGEHGHVVIYWKKPKNKETEQKEDEKKNPPLLRYYKVFNIAQCHDLPEGLVEPHFPKEHDPILECESVIHSMPQCPPIKHEEQQAYYDKVQDYINMPKPNSFKSSELYYATLFHELVHSTGSEKRLNRKSITEMAEFGSDMYSLEELIAELGSAYLSSHTGIQNDSLQNSPAYIQGWLGRLKNDKRFIIMASGQAQRAVDFILNLQVEERGVNDSITEVNL
jgi:antirestriction protein ArdC